MNMTIVVGNNDFGKNLASRLNAQFVLFEQRTFPDGEVCPRILGRVDDDVILVNRMKLPLEPNRYFVETVLLVKKLKDLGAKNVDVVMPYFVYGRQDKVFRSGEPLSARFVLEVLHNAGADRFFTVSSHTQREQDRLSLSKSAYNINGFVSIGNYLRGKSFSNPVIVGPDSGAEFFAKTVASILGCDYVLLDKRRDLDTGTVEMHSTTDFSGKEAIIVDDIISSGSTIVPAVDICKKQGAKSVYCYVVHLVSDKGIGRISPHVSEFLVSDTIDTPISGISVVDQLAERFRS